MNVPIVDRIITGHISFLSLLASICNAPANSKKPSIIFISTCSKLILATSLCASVENVGIKLPTKTISNDENIANIIIPIVPGNLIHRSLT